MGFNELRDRIISEAEKTSGEIIKEANIEANNILEEALLEAENIKSSGLRSIQRDINMLKSQSLASIKLEMQKNILGEVQNMLEELMSKASEEIINSPEYFSYLLKGISDLELKGDEEILLSRYDIQRFGDRLINEIRKLKGAINLTISEGEIKGGFILKGREFDINNSLEISLQNIRPEIEQMVWQIFREAEAECR